jgi:hypothetical protein
MNFEFRLACSVFVALASMLGLNHSPAKAALFRVDANVVATFTTGPVPSATGSFSFQFDDAFLMGAPSGDRKDWPVSQFQTSLNPIGTTTFSPSNVEGYVFYNQGSLRQVLVGGVGPTILDENSVGGNSYDFYISLIVKPNGQLDNTFGRPGEFVWANKNPNLTIYSGNIDASASSLAITLVPEPASVVLASLVCMFAIGVRRRRIGWYRSDAPR